MYDIREAIYFDERDIDKELRRVFDVCHTCRMCFSYCPSFPSMFDAIDRHEERGEGEVEALTTAKTKVIEATAPYLNPPIAAHPGLDPALRESLRRALLTLHEEPAGRTVLSRLGIERFVAPPRAAGEGGR